MCWQCDRNRRARKSDGVVRFPISEEGLAWLAGQELYRRTEEGAEFTAYDVTLALREANPLVDIRHDRVREFVHEYMGALLVQGDYEATMRRFDNDFAVMYRPAPVPAWPAGQLTIKLLPLN
ncbi:MAG TPA: hypothetical protein VFR15_04945 [Chloroflexia bacterium]|nr:hypothetical protein [Chloroflexia bacterium]